MRNMLPPPPDANVQVMSKRLRAVEGSEEVKDLADQEKLGLVWLKLMFCRTSARTRSLASPRKTLAKASDQESIKLIGARIVHMRSNSYSLGLFQQAAHLLVTCLDIKRKRAIQEGSRIQFIQFSNAKLTIYSKLTDWQSKVKSSISATK
jgi:hypothetical protein